jgi:hypothetical protein
MNRPRPVILFSSVLAALQILSAGAALSDVIGFTAAAFFTLCVAAAQGGIGFYVQNVVTPVADPRAGDGTPLVPIGVQPELLDDEADAHLGGDGT